MLTQAHIAQLYEKHGHAIYVRCLSLIGRPDRARELMQETFYQACRSAARFEGRSSAFTFLYRIATNLSIDQLRRRKSAGGEPLALDACRDGLAGGPGAASHHSPGPDARAQAVSELGELTYGLDEDTLMVAVMSHVDGLTQEEIAAALDLSRRTVGKRLKKFLTHTRRRAGASSTEKPLPTAMERAHGE